MIKELRSEWISIWILFKPGDNFWTERILYNILNNLFWKIKSNAEQAGAELGQAQVKLDDIVEVVVDVVVIAVVQVEV